MLPHTAKIADDICLDPLDADRRGQPRPGPDHDEHRLAAVRPAELRRVDAVRPGQRVGRPARLRRAHQRQGHQRRREQLRLRLPADRCTAACRSAAPAIRSCTCRTRRASTPTRSARRSTRSTGSTSWRSQTVGDPEIAARIQSYEMAYRLQTSAPELMDLSQRAEGRRSTRYGIKDAEARPASPATACWPGGSIERGVRFVQLFHEAWDQHGNLTAGVKQNAGDTDQASAALVTDLKQRGLLDDTLVIWGGEFGRTPMVQGGNDGRDHHNRCFSIWLAGGGIKAGHVHGADRRPRLQRRRRPGPRPRPARHAPAPARLRPHAAHLPLPGPRLPPDRRARQRGQEATGLRPGGRSRFGRAKPFREGRSSLLSPASRAISQLGGSLPCSAECAMRPTAAASRGEPTGRASLARRGAAHCHTGRCAGLPAGVRSRRPCCRWPGA